MFQGSLIKNVSKLTKRNPPKVNKIQRMITVFGKKEDNKQGLIKCTITFKEEMDCTKFKESFIHIMGKLPEIVKATPKPEKKEQDVEKNKEEKKKE